MAKPSPASSQNLPHVSGNPWMAVERPGTRDEIRATRHASEGARALAAVMPRLVLESRRIAATVIHGLHGRRRAGSGENFWQFRRYVPGEEARRVDWRRSARGDELYVREQEWEALPSIPSAARAGPTNTSPSESVFLRRAATRFLSRAAQGGDLFLQPPVLS